MDKKYNMERWKKNSKPKFKKGKLPINLHKMALREKRQRNENRPKKRRKKNIKFDFKCSENEALVQATENELKNILAESDALSDIPYDCTPEELLGEIALSEGNGTIIYVQRDELPTLTVVLPQEDPTIANLKRAIESAARVQLTRDLRERYEERLKRRAREPSTSDISKVKSSTRVDKHVRSTGELVCSTTRNGHQHRSNVSWRFLWRVYMLYHIETNQPIDDSNGRRLLRNFGIENATTLKFCKRENYFGRKRQ